METLPDIAVFTLDQKPSANKPSLWVTIAGLIAVYIGSLLRGGFNIWLAVILLLPAILIGVSFFYSSSLYKIELDKLKGIVTFFYTTRSRSKTICVPAKELIAQYREHEITKMVGPELTLEITHHGKVLASIIQNHDYQAGQVDKLYRELFLLINA